MSSLTLSHWGLYEVEEGRDGRPALRPHRDDPAPSPIGLDRMSAQVERLRVLRPAVRRGWLEGRRGDRRPGMRGREPFVELRWDEVIPLLAGELSATVADRGNEAIFGGSYGWASAGRFHHAQGLVHRFLTAIGGYVAHRNSYSHAAASVILPHIVGPFDDMLNQQTSWEVMAEHTELFVGFGGVPLKNVQVSSGGVVAHTVPAGLSAMRRRGARIVNISPIRSDIDAGYGAEWLPIRPGTDVALMLALAHVLVDEGLADGAFLESHCVGFPELRAYIGGRADGVAKTPEWAARLTDIPAATIRALARDMASRRTMLNAAWALQRASHGEQPYWMMVALAAILGQIGLPGGGFGLGYGSASSIGSRYGRSPGPTMPQGRNPVPAFIPVARIADMLLQPGGRFAYDGGTYTYPHVDLVYWAGGNPFHHHQDLNRLVEAWRRPSTVVTHEQYWTPMARMADFVLPATTTLERNDLGFSGREGFVVPMKKVKVAPGAALDDYDIFARLAATMGVGTAYTEGLDEDGWLRRLYSEWVAAMGPDGASLPDFDSFWSEGALLPARHAREPVVFLDAFRRDPVANPLATPSGRIEIASQAIGGFALPDVLGHPAWYEPAEWLDPDAPRDGTFHLISHQPGRKLHSQLDHAPYSAAGKIEGREPLLMNPADAAAVGLAEGDIVEVHNERGACLAALVLTDAIKPHVVCMATGAWFDPADWAGRRPLEKHGNPNVLTRDAGTSSLAQGCTAMTCTVRVRRFAQPLPPVTAFDLPEGIGEPVCGGDDA